MKRLKKPRRKKKAKTEMIQVPELKHAKTAEPQKRRDIKIKTKNQKFKIRDDFYLLKKGKGSPAPKK